MAASTQSFAGIVSRLIGLAQSIVVLLMAVGLLLFLWGVFNYISQYGEESKRSEAVQYMLYGLIGLFVMVAVWGLVGLLTGTFGFTLGIPQIK